MMSILYGQKNSHIFWNKLVSLSSLFLFFIFQLYKTRTLIQAYSAINLFYLSATQ